MSKEQRDAEIDRILDLSVAQENSRLAQGGLGPGDLAGDAQVIEHDGQKYLATRSCTCGPNEACSNCPKSLAPQPIALGTAEPPHRDEYRELIEAPEEPQPTVTTQDEINRRVDEIRSRVMSYDKPARLDIGYLLTVIDAFPSL